MAVFNKFESFSEALANGQIDCTNDNLKIFLTNTTPDYTTMQYRELPGPTYPLPEPTGVGYTAGGQSTNNTASRTGGVTSVIGVDVIWTAGAGGIGPFRYVVLYDSTNAQGDLIGAWDYGSSITLAAGETLTVDFGSSMFTVT